MKAHTIAAAALVLLCLFAVQTDAQRRRASVKKRPAAAKPPKAPEIGKLATVIDEKLSVLRESPSLYAVPIQRMRLGRRVQITGVRDVDGIKFYRVTALPDTIGWVQADAIFGKFRAGDEERLARLVQAAGGFDQIELAATFLDMYPRSNLRPPILLLFGDLVESTAVKLSRDAGKRLTRREMAATTAPEHSYFLNFVSLDRYRRLGIVFVFDPATRNYHYDGTSWKEIIEKFPKAGEALEAKKRLDSLEQKMNGSAEN